MKTIAALVSLCAVLYLALRLRPTRPIIARGIERGIVLRIGRRWLVLRVQIGVVV